MTRSLLLLIILLPGFSVLTFGQLKKTYLGKYEGTIPAYEINTGSERIEVEAAAIEIRLEAAKIAMHIGDGRATGTYTVLFDTRAYFVLEAKMDGHPAPERIIVYRKGKKISREGIRPQPDALLEKQKK